MSNSMHCNNYIPCVIFKFAFSPFFFSLKSFGNNSYCFRFSKCQAFQKTRLSSLSEMARAFCPYSQKNLFYTLFLNLYELLCLFFRGTPCIIELKKNISPEKIVNKIIGAIFIRIDTPLGGL